MSSGSLVLSRRARTAPAGALFTSAPGLERAVADALLNDLPAARVCRRLSGLVELESRAPAGELRHIAYVNNAFALLSSAGAAPDTTPAELVRSLLEARDLDEALRRSRGRGGRAFRVVFSHENRLSPLDPRLRAQVEARVARATGLRPDTRGGDREYWILQRSEGCAFFAARVTRRAATEKDLEKGELRPEVAHLLCRMTQPSERDRFLDPFCGSGAIALQRARLPFRRITCIDSDRERVRRTRRRFERQRFAAHVDPKAIRIERGDARQLEGIESGSVDALVSDPPWGHYAPLPAAPAEFYGDVLRETRRVLAPSGAAIFLCGERAGFADALESMPGLRLADRCEILLSGRPASVFRLRPD